VRFKKIKKLCESRATLLHYATIARDLNAVKRTCKSTEFCMAVLTRKKVKYNSESTLKKQYIFKRIAHSAESVSTERCSFYKIYWIILIFYAMIHKAKNPVPNRHPCYSPDIT